MEKKIGTIHPPERPVGVPAAAQWILGQGAGAWFYIQKSTNNQHYQIQRFAEAGNLDCDRIFELAANAPVFDIDQPYEFTPVSHCLTCRITQLNQLFIFQFKGA
jgi:hypothetical protein